MKKFLTLALAIVAMSAMAFAGKNLTVDCGDQVQISATPKTGYHFTEWNDHNTDNPRTINPTQDSTFKAFFAINRYAIIFNNWNDTALQKDTLDHGSAVSYKGATPTKTGDAQYSYTFSGWSPNISSTATAAATYTAQFDETVNKYQITFLNWDSTVLESKQWEYGKLPSYTGTPTRPADDSCTYVFSGWDKVISTVTGAETYVAQYNSTTQSYTITTAGENGTTTGDGTYQYGTKVTLTATPNACYEFVQWNDGDTSATREITVTGNATYTATFKKIQYTITVESDDEDQGTADVVKL